MPVAKRSQPLVPNAELKINGSSLPAEAIAYILSVIVDDEVDLPGMFSIVLAGADTQGEVLPWVDDKRFDLGGSVEIKLGYGNNIETVFKGEITGLEPEFSVDRLPGLLVRGFDRRHRLLRGRKTLTFVKQKDSEIASKIAGDAGLTASVTDSKVTHEYVYQHNQTDLEFLLLRARRIEYELLIEDKKLIFRPVANADGEAMTLSLTDDLLEFSPRLTSMGQVSEVTVRGWDVKEKKEIVGKAKAGDEVSTMGGQKSGGKIAQSAFGESVELMSDIPVLTQAEADQLAKAKLNNLALGLITGEGVCYGRTDLRAGKVIKIEGVGKRFSGQYYVTRVSHRYTQQQGYQTHFAVRRNAS